MATADHWRSLWDHIRRGETRLPSRVAIPPDHVGWGESASREPFRPNEHYFQVRINEMFLSFDRRWFAEYDPMVLVVTEFTYDKKEQAVPFVVGPALLENKGQEAPQGMVFSDTRVAGIHPYRGGRLTLSVVLSRVKRKDFAKLLLGFVESAAGALDFATSLSAYVKVAGVVLDGVEAMFGLDGSTQALIGYRREFDPDAGDELEPSYFALIDLAEEEVKANALWVKDHKLLMGDSLETAVPFREADYVLYSILQSTSRGDDRTLGFYPLFERVQQEAMSPGKDGWVRAKGDMLSLWQTLVLSPDLTGPHASSLAEAYKAKMVELHSTMGDLSTLGPGAPPKDEAPALKQAAEIMDL